MLLAELEIRHTRAVAPTRRIALGSQWLPTDPAPGYGGILLGGIVAAHLEDLHPELRDELVELADDLENGRRIPQPRLRHRFQVDVV
ncbi:MAG: rRNA (guanine1516-N2)-methyltransferase, partial [Acidimicrobiaceae bacterium]